MVKQAGLVRLSGTRISMVEPRGSEEEKQFVRLQSRHLDVWARLVSD